jgi:hypothetical protein
MVGLFIPVASLLTSKSASPFIGDKMKLVESECESESLDCAGGLSTVD